MTPEDMARELRAAGWEKTGPWHWSSPGDFHQDMHLDEAHVQMKELARTRAQGTVTTPVVGGRSSDMAGKMTTRNAPVVLARLIVLLSEKDKDFSVEVTSRLNAALDEMADDDLFGTEGQSDPRGDRR